MSSGNSTLNVPSFPEASQLSGQDTWRAFKDRVELIVQVRGLQGYLDGSIPKPTTATYIYTSQTPSPPDSLYPSPSEWNQRERMVASIIYLNCNDPIGIGIERDDNASKTWKYLIKKYEARDEQRIHIADTNLREQKYNPETTTMEEHEKKMKNLLKSLHNLGGSCNNYQFRLIVISSMPEAWRDYVLNVPGIFSSEAFTYLHRLYLEKVGRHRDSEVDPIKKQVAALFAQHVATHAASSSTPNPRKRLMCTNPICPSKVGHTIEKCWSKGGGAEGKAPKAWKDKYGTDGTKAASSDTFEPLDVYVGSAHSPRKDDGTCATSPSLTTTPDPPTRIALAVLDKGVGQEERKVDTRVPYPGHPLVSKSQCTSCCRIEPIPLYTPKRFELIRTFIDSGATDHCWVRRDQFVQYTEVSEKGNSALAGEGGQFFIKGIGTVQFETQVDGEKRKIRLENVKHTPEFAHNLISLSTLDRRGYRGEWGNGVVVVKTHEGSVMMEGMGKGRMYEVDVLYAEVNSARSHQKAVDIHTWHRRLGHVAIPRILRMANKGLVDGLDITSRKVHGLCEACLYGKAIRRPFDENLEHETEVLERVHIDLFGPTRTQSLGGASYLMLFTDGRSTVKVPACLPNKRSETTLKEFHKFRVKAENQTRRSVRAIRIDGGKELDNRLMEHYCEQRGIDIEKIPPYSSAANGMAERANRTVIEGTRTFLDESGLPHSFWAEAATTFCYVDGFVPSARFPDDIPIEVWTRRRHDVSHLRPFGCRCWPTLPNVRTDGKLARQSIEGVMIGYMGRRGYKIYLPSTRTWTESRDVTFEEGESRRTRKSPNSDSETFDVDEVPSGDSGVDITGNPINAPNVNPDPISDVTPQNEPLRTVNTEQNVPRTPPAAEPHTPAAQEPRRSTRNRKVTTRLLESEASEEREREAKEKGEPWANNLPSDQQPLALIVENPWAFASTDSEYWIPATYKQAMQRPDLWLEPMQAEYDLLMEKGVWELVELPPGANLIGGRWTYAIKWGARGEVVRRKGRYVAQGFNQIYGLDFDKTYGAVVRFESLRITLAIIVVLGLHLFQLDFKGAFLNSPISHDVYMKQPEGFIKKGEEHLVCKLRKSIYGTKQGSHDWQATLAEGYKEDGYVTSRADPCMRYRRVKEEYTLTGTYGDDVFGGSSTGGGKGDAVSDLSKRWEAGEVTSNVLLGMTIKQDAKSGSITISQQVYFEKMIEHFGFQKIQPRRTPLPPGLKVKESPNPLPEEERIFMSDKPYRQVVGSVLWGSACTRPDIAYASNVLARYQLNPGRYHWDLVEWLVGYIKWSIHYSITYTKPEGTESKDGAGLKPVGYVDADYAGCLDTRRSTSGHVFIMAGAPVSWSSKRQATVAMSTVEAEYVSLARASQQGVWMSSFLSEIDLDQDGPVTLYGDNEGANSLTENSKQHALVKHIDVRHHHIREKVENGDIVVKGIRSTRNLADVLTKPLAGPEHLRVVKMLGLDRTE